MYLWWAQSNRPTFFLRVARTCGRPPTSEQKLRASHVEGGNLAGHPVAYVKYLWTWEAGTVGGGSDNRMQVNRSEDAEEMAMVREVG